MAHEGRAPLLPLQWRGVLPSGSGAIMPTVPTRWLFMVLGDGEEHYLQVHLAAASVLAWMPGDDRIVIASDRPDRLRWLASDPRIALSAIDAATLERWRGSHGFFWRLKLACIQAHQLDDQALVYLDSDTYARSDLAGITARLADGACLMHEPEELLATSRRRGNRQLWQAAGGRSWCGVEADRSTRMWNAGVVALAPRDAVLARRALEICDALCAATGIHSLHEQLALSLSLGAGGRLEPAEPWIDHYWGNKRDHLVAITARLALALAEGRTPAEVAKEVRRRPILLPLHIKRRPWQKWLARLLHVR